MPVAVAQQKVCFFISVKRLCSLFFYLIVNVIKLSVCSRFYSEQQKEQFSIKLSHRLLKSMNVSVQIHGQLPDNLQNTLIVANHISWLDILVISSVAHPKFVAKKEIACWPIVGRLSKSFGAVFVDRGNKRSLLKVNEQLSAILQEGSCIAVFPEGKTTVGLSVEPFKSSLFEPICQAKGYVLPVALQYLDANNQLTTRSNFAGDITAWRCLWNILTCDKLTATVTFEAPLNTKDVSERNELAIKAQQVIAKYW